MANNKLREALETARKCFEGIAECSSDPQSRQFAKWALEEWVKPALAAPPRNCDEMPNIDELTMFDLEKSPCKSTLECASREELLALVRWLLTPATEKEGGAK